MKTANYEYKCRRCGEVESSLCTAERNGATYLIDAILGLKRQAAMAPRLLGHHCCKDGGMGVSDLIGYSVKEE